LHYWLSWGLHCWLSWGLHLMTIFILLSYKCEKVYSLS
jgi:hypothetical protein